MWARWPNTPPADRWPVTGSYGGAIRSITASRATRAGGAAATHHAEPPRRPRGDRPSARRPPGSELDQRDHEQRVGATSLQRSPTPRTAPPARAAARAGRARPPRSSRRPRRCRAWRSGRGRAAGCRRPSAPRRRGRATPRAAGRADQREHAEDRQRAATGGCRSARRTARRRTARSSRRSRAWPVAGARRSGHRRAGRRRSGLAGGWGQTRRSPRGRVDVVGLVEDRAVVGGRPARRAARLAEPGGSAAPNETSMTATSSAVGHEVRRSASLTPVESRAHPANVASRAPRGS